MDEAAIEATFSKDEILVFLKAVDDELKEKTRIILIGGAAAILAFGNKRGSIDIDTFNKIDHLEKAIAKATKKTGLKIGFSRARVVFAPENFENRVAPYTEGKFKFLDVYVPEVHDFVLMKLARLLERDLDDIVEINKKHPLDANRLLKIFMSEMKYYAGDETLLRDRYYATIETLFGSKVYKAHRVKLEK